MMKVDQRDKGLSSQILQNIASQSAQLSINQNQYSRVSINSIINLQLARQLSQYAIKFFIFHKLYIIFGQKKQFIKNQPIISRQILAEVEIGDIKKMGSKFFNRIKMLDMFGKPVTLNVFGKKRHKTLVGAFITSCAMIFFIFAFQKKLIEFLQNESININQRTVRDDQIPLDINPTTLMFAVRFDLNLENNALKGYPFSFKITQVEQSRKHQTQYSQKEFTETSYTTEVVPCTIEHFLTQQKSDLNIINDFFLDVSVDQFYCPHMNSNFTLQGNRNSASFKYMKQLGKYQYYQEFVSVFLI